MPRSIALLAALLVTLLATRAPAQGDAAAPPTDPKEMARGIGEEGLALHAEGRFAEAYEKFATAERIQHSPVLLLWMARSKRALGKLLEAAELYRRLAGESLGSDTSAKWVAAKKDAAAELTALRGRVPTLEVRLARGTPSSAKVTVDEVAATPGRAIELDPGERVVRVATDGQPVVERRVRLAEGSHETIEIAVGGAASPRSEQRGSLVPGGVVLGLGMAAIAAGAVTGAIALDLAGDVEDGCIDNQCLPEDEGKADDATALGGVSTALLIGGAVASAVGVVLLVVRPGGAARERSAFVAGPRGARALIRF